MSVKQYGRDVEPVGFTEETLYKVYQALLVAELEPKEAERCINEMQNAGILFRERIPVSSENKRVTLRCPYCTEIFSSQRFVTTDDMLNVHIRHQHSSEREERDWRDRIKLACPLCDFVTESVSFEKASAICREHGEKEHGDFSGPLSFNVIK